LNFADDFQKSKFEFETILENDANQVTDLIQTTSVLKNVTHNETLFERHYNPRE
jgi:hypothetical protein